jgi:hypothetical protein
LAIVFTVPTSFAAHPTDLPVSGMRYDRCAGIFYDVTLGVPRFICSGGQTEPHSRFPENVIVNPSRCRSVTILPHGYMAQRKVMVWRGNGSRASSECVGVLPSACAITPPPRRREPGAVHGLRLTRVTSPSQSVIEMRQRAVQVIASTANKGLLSSLLKV